MPARISRSGDIPRPRRASPATHSVVTSAAANAKIAYSGAGTRSAIASAIVNAAPALPPVRYGSTSPLRSMPCSKLPLTPSAAPTSAAIKTRGSRSDHTIATISPLACGWANAKITALKGTVTEPIAMPAAIAATSSAHSTIRRYAPRNNPRGASIIECFV